MVPTLSEAFRRAISKGRNLAPNGEALTLERIVQMYGNGQVQVSCRDWGPAVIPVTGEGLRTLRAGQKVAVAWEKGRPVVAIAHTAKRSGAPVPLPRPTAPLVEDLFIATRPSDGVTDVFFRNFDDVTALRLDRFLPTAGFSTLRWGPLNDRFFVQEGSLYHIFKLDREPDEPFAPGADPSDGITLERTENVATNTTVLASGTSGGDITPQTPGTIRISVCLAVDGSLIGSFTIGAIHPAANVWANVPGPNFTSSGTSPFTATTFAGGGRWPVLADLTHGVVLLSGYANPELFGPWDLFDPSIPTNIAPFVVGDGATIAAGQAFFRTMTWVSANSFIAQIDPPFEGHTEIGVTWWFGYSTEPSAIQATAEPLLVLGADVPPDQRLRGVVAWTRREFSILLGQTFNVANWNAFIVFGGQPGYNPVAPAAPFPVTPQSGALAKAVFEDVTVELYPLDRPARGLSYAPTYRRVVWRAPATVSFLPADGGLNAGGADSAGFVSLLGGGAPVQISPTLRASVGQRGLVVAMTDFLYQLDNPAVALPAEADVHFFVDAWAFGGATNLNTAAADFPSELAELEDVKALADLPAGVTQPTSAGLFSLYVNNDPATLEALGLFEELPTVV